MVFEAIYGEDRHGNSLTEKPGNRADYVASNVRDAQSDPGANRPELQKLQNSLSNLKASDPATYLKLDAALKQNGNDDKFSDLASERPDLVNKHMSEIAKDPSRLNTILNTIEQESKTTAKPSVSMNESPRHGNQAVGQAAETLAKSGQHETAEALSRNADKMPQGAVTTVSNAINSNPKAATSMLGSVASELESPALNTAMRFGGMAAMFSMFQNFMPMLTNMFSGMSGGIFANLGNSAGLAAMGNTPGNPLAQKFSEMGGVDTNATKMLSVDPQTGIAGNFGAPAINTPAASPMQRNTLSAVPGMTPSPTMG